MANKITRPVRSIAAAVAIVCAVAALYAAMGQSFRVLAPGFAQHLYGVSSLRSSSFSLGGVVVLQDGTVISAECRTNTTALHVFDPAATFTKNNTVLHAESVSGTIAGGCGLAFFAVGGQNYIFSNINDSITSDGDGTFGVARIAWPSLTTTKMAPGLPGNALGIAVDPVTGNLVYAGSACRLTTPAQAACPLYSLNPSTGAVTTFMSLPGSDFAFIHGIAFDPTGTYLFVTNRTFTPGELDVIDRSGTVLSRTTITADPVGIGFHAASPTFVVTNNQDGTMTRFDFPADNYALAPAPSLFASGGSRGDMIQAGPDGCLYVTQLQTRYNDGTPDNFNSIVQICGGFAPPPGITPNPPPAPSSLCGFVYSDDNDNGANDPGEHGIAGVAITLTGSDRLDLPVSRSTTTNGSGRYCFDNLAAGTYTISETQPAGYFDGKDTQGTPGNGTTGNDSFNGIVLGVGQAGDNNNFGELLPSSLGGYVYRDDNNNGIRNGNEAGIAGVTVTLAGTDDLGAAVNMTAVTGVEGAYRFGSLRPGTYSITETQPAGYTDGKDTQGTPGTGTATNDAFTNIRLDAGVDGQDNNFGEIAVPPDTMPPTCTIDVKKGPPLKVTMTFRDSGSGIARFEIVDAVNLTIKLPSFSAPSPGPLVVTGTRINQRKSDGMTIRAIDAAGNTMLCDPVSTTVTRLKHENGIQTFNDIPDVEHFVTVENDNPGLRRLDVIVNGRTFRVRKLDDYEIALIDISSAMAPGPVNTITLVPYGKKGDSAIVMIADH